MKFKIVRDSYSGFNVMYKKAWWDIWHYARRPAGQCGSEFRYIWRWDTEKGAQAFINQELKRLKKDA